MSHTETHQATRLLAAWRAGDPDAPQALAALVYDDLREIGRAHV